MDGLVRSLAIGIGWNVDDKGLQQANRQTNGLIDSADRAEKEVDQLGRSGEEAGNKLTRGFRSAKNTLSSGMGLLREYKYELTAMAAAGATGMFQLAKRAGDAQETVNKFRVVFGDFADESRDWAKNYSDQIGRSEYRTLDWLNSFQDVLVPMGLARDEAAGLSQEMVTLAADLGSFNNVATADAANLMQSALIGNHRAVRSLGIQLSEATLDLAAQREGYEKNFAELDNLTKMQLRFQEMIRQSDDAVDDATRTALEFNNQQLALKGNLRDTAIAMGNQYIPSMNDGLIAVNKFLDGFQESEWVGPTARVGGLATGLGLVGAAAAWLGGPGLLAVAGFALTIGTLAVVLEDLWSFFKGKDSLTGDILSDLKPFADELNGLASEIEDTSAGLGKMIAGGFWNEELFNEGKKEFEQGYDDIENRFKSWTNSFTGWVEEKFNIQSILEDKFSFAKERPDWVPEKLNWWGEDGINIEPPDIKGVVENSWNTFMDWWKELEIGFDFEPPDIKGMIDEQLNKLPDWSKELLNIDSEVIEKESKNISNNNKSETNVNDNSVIVEKGAINIQGATDPKAVGKEVEKKLNTYLKMQAGEVGAN